MTRNPVFVKIDKYTNIADSIGQINGKIEEAKKILEKIEEIKKQEDEEIQNWKHEVATAEEKIHNIKDILSTTDNV